MVPLGGGGAGTSTLARALADRCDLPVVHLDQLYWQPGWVEPDPLGWSGTVSSLAAAPRWLMEGNYASTLAPRPARADVVVLLDLPRRVTIPRVLRRAWRHRHGTRPDMAPGCPEKVDLAFLQWIWNFRRQSLPGILAVLDAAPHRPALVRLRSARQVRHWLAALWVGPDRGPFPSPDPGRRNPEPGTRNPEPGTRNPEPGTDLRRPAPPRRRPTG